MYGNREGHTLILANPHGYCAGVEKAINTLDRVIEIYKDKTIYVYHDIIHNDETINKYRKLGIIFKDTIDDIPEESLLLFSAHGVSPSIREKAIKMNLKIIDTTCPLVHKVHLEIQKYKNNNYKVILIGEKEHEEVEGTFGEAPNDTYIVYTNKDVDNLPDMLSTNKLVWLSQTTLSVDYVNNIVEILKNRFSHVETPPLSDICYATQNRQNALKSCMEKYKINICFIIGSYTSSNCKKLYYTASKNIKNTFIINDKTIDKVFNKLLLNNIQDSTILISSSASTSEDYFNKFIELLKDKYKIQNIIKNIYTVEKTVFPINNRILKSY